MADGPRVNIDIAEKRFAVLPAPLLKDFHLTVEPASVVALVGPSGVGKSSLLRMIAGIDGDFSGSITIDGIDAAAAPPPGFVFQDARLFPWLTAIQNVRAVRASTSDASAREWLRRVGLGGYEDAYPRELSGGMQRRVALARAFSVNPQLLLLDEPFVSLDRQIVAELQQSFLTMFNDTGATVILVTHMADDAARLADRAVLLKGMPARIVSDIHLDIARDKRTPQDLARLTELIAGARPEETL